MARAAYSPFVPQSGFVHLDQGQLAYQELMHGYEIARNSGYARTISVSLASPMGIIDKMVYPFSMSEYVASLISTASENLQMVGRDVERTSSANFSNSHYTLIRSATEQLSLALLLLDGGDERFRCQMLLRAAEDNHLNEVKFLEAVIRRSKSSLSNNYVAPDAYKQTFEGRVLHSNSYALELLENGHQLKKDSISSRFPKEKFGWEKLPDTVSTLEKATKIFLNHSQIELLGGDLSTIWRVCSGNAHGKMWSEKQLSRQTKDSNTVLNSFSEPEPRVLSTIYLTIANLCQVAMQLYVYQTYRPHNVSGPIYG